MSDAAARMDRMYRNQRLIYDFSRKYYLLGRDETIARLGAADGEGALEIGCGTGRNLIRAARSYPRARFYGLDVSRAMLDTAEAAIRRADLDGRIVVAQGDATAFDPATLFNRPVFERVMISYTLSMIPPWREALAHALDVVAPGGALYVVDFGDCAGLPGPFKAALRRWLASFDVTPRDDLGATLDALAGARGLASATEGWRRGYATLAVARRAAPHDRSSYSPLDVLHWTLAELGGASGQYSSGPYDPYGCCPCPRPWALAHGAHLLT